MTSIRSKIQYELLLLILMSIVWGSNTYASDLSFEPFVSYAPGGNRYTLTIGDFNNDSIPDIATIDFVAPGYLSILLGNGDGTFSTTTDVEIGVASRSLAVGDLDGDGNLDIVSTHIGSSSSFRNNKVVISLGNGDGTFASPLSYSVNAFSPLSVIIGDLNGDNIPDLATANINSNSVSVLLGNGDGTFGNATTVFVGLEPFSVAIGDLDGDTYLDIVSANRGSGNVSILWGIGDGTFGNVTNISIGENPIFVTVRDLEGDGHLDIITANDTLTTNHISVLLGDGDGTFETIDNYSAAQLPRSVVAADIDGDNILDLVASSFSSARVSILLGNSDGTFGVATNVPAGRGTWAVEVADFNSDGRLDIATANQVDDNITVLINSTTLSNQPPVISNPGPQSVFETELLTFDIMATDLELDNVTLTAQNLPAGASFFGGVFTWTPALLQAGLYTATFIAVDDGIPAASSLLEVLITVYPDPFPKPDSKDKCKNGGHVNFFDDNNQPFTNQGQCIAYVNLL